jgi:parallel beta-helix repeat protein
MRHHLFRSSIAVFGTSAVVALMAIPASAAATQAQRVVVPLGHSIQKAINEAPPGTTIVLEPGTYAQSFQIRKDHITVQGSGPSEDGTVLVPPADLPKNMCRRMTGGSGACVIASRMDHGQVINWAVGDTITGILFENWRGMGVFGYGTDGLTITNNAAVNYGGYGFARFNSMNSTIENNTAQGNGTSEAGVYVGDSPAAHTVVRGNTITGGNTWGVFVRHSHGVEVAFNNTSGNCEGIVGLDDGQPGGVGDLSIHDNVAHANNLFCPPNEGPPLQGGGILLLGATDSSVWHNNVLGNQGDQVNSGGIVVFSASQFTGGSDPINDTIKNNTSFSNGPADIIWDGSGTGNTFTGNQCGVSMPSGLC